MRTCVVLALLLAVVLGPAAEAAGPVDLPPSASPIDRQEPAGLKAS